MYRHLVPFLGPIRSTPSYSHLTPQSSPPPRPTVKLCHYPYFVRRNSRASLPVYTDIRNGGTRHLVLIRNVHGNINFLADSLRKSLFKPGSPSASRLKVDVVAQRNIVLTGGRWKNDVMHWLVAKGF
ncbi:hypothetical protein SERLA73DRAFT_185583 [Serpula lacrymans var. lacrymans S7.3]|uniref:Large ribosomal subunit protein mL49 n=2 Tax=Serpula lacrymans var. lacrymans TaxID=341189 RepID=F8Q626_SERL3|nr:uncharacterized protein SERLADRAFT_474138 [Serpula lacrymans var. lacrymans S7.9]EGN96064.1 hypothetical protein SERLA73DRAFT_185583 [Serpula lacrymans var. lacrymans S7.3]EGO21587.1 hypothetical protein SERLADRAFT_474138 [Serpula lacrymans var. lacrymans S7.9]